MIGQQGRVNGSRARIITLITTCIAILLLVILYSPMHSHATDLPVIEASGTLSSNTTWNSGNVYHIANKVTVPSGVTLTIEPGAIIKFSFNDYDSSGIIVSSGGTLDAEGNALSPINFTSYHDDSLGGDSNGNGASTSPGNNDYHLGVVDSGGAVTIKYAAFNYGQSALSVSCGAGYGQVAVSDNSFSNPIAVSNCSRSTVSLDRNQFSVPSGSVPLYLTNSDPTVVTLAGINKNTFSGSGINKTLYLQDDTIPSGATWSLDAGSGAIPVLYNKLTVNGTLALNAGTGFKFAVQDYNSAGINVNSGGALNVAGTSISPVMFTSYKDDAFGGDSNNDGSSSTAALGDYYYPVLNNGGSVAVSNGIFRNAYSGILTSSVATGNDLDVADSSFTNLRTAIGFYNGSISLARNNFNVSSTSNGAAVVVDGTVNDLSGIVLSGADENTFTGSGPSVTITVSGTVPTSKTWDVSDSSNVVFNPVDVTVNGTLNVDNAVTYANASTNGGRINALTVNGTMNVAAGTILKLRDYSQANGIRVNTGADLNINGTSSHPVTFTSIRDDAIGGDTTGDGSTAPALGNFGFAIAPNGGAVTVDHAVFKYGTVGIGDITGSSSSFVAVNDSSFSDLYVALQHNGGSTSLQRNNFDVRPGANNAAVNIENSNPAGIILSGANKNMFASSGPNATLQVSGVLPTSVTWNVDSGSNVVLKPTDLTVNGTLTIDGNVVYGSTTGTGGNIDAIKVNGTLNLEAGTIVKLASYYMYNGIKANTGSSFNINGTSGSPVIFTSSRDDSVAGDTVGDGITTGASGDYGVAITNNGGSILADHGTIRYAGVAVNMMSGTANFQNSNINHDSYGLSVSNGKAIYRGSITDVTQGIYACNWQFSCNVDAAYVDWGSASGPYPTLAGLICGSVTFSPWVHGGSTYTNPDIFFTQACDSTASPSAQLQTRVSSYMSKIASLNMDCSGGNNTACDVADSYRACIVSAWSVASGSSAFSMPTGSPISDPVAYYTGYLSAASAFIQSLEQNSIVGSTFDVGGSLIDEVSTITALNGAYDSCFASH